ncbi:hypothetical protein IM816_13065 [Luteibacter flocculans]|uniref:PH domain-containing protein n=1 Tax=Luteibacter flocculans TaxID=2780091 RepID=A0ABY4SXV3_9GAMM|nr:hypothetical protein [Luteibacter flocculans]URL57548.1 hypothetical protein IM816_13065 [Luteibacter flocculans]
MIVGVALLLIAGVVITFSGFLLWAPLGAGYPILCFVIGAFSLPMMVMASISIIEDMTFVIDPCGIEQIRLFRRGSFLKRGRIAWDDVEKFSQKNLLYRFKSADFEVRVNIALFNNGEEFVRYVESHLPPDKLKVPLPQCLRPSKKIVIGTWFCVLGVLLGGIALSSYGKSLTGHPHAWVWGSAMIIASFIWFGRAIESSSVVLDRNGLEQIKIVHGGRFFARHRIEWKDAQKMPPFLSTCKFRNADVCIRVDASYFDDNETVSDFLDEHMRSGGPHRATGRVDG